MKHSNVIDLFKVVAKPYPEYFWLKHTDTLERIMNQFHKRADAQKRRAV